MKSFIKQVLPVAMLVLGLGISAVHADDSLYNRLNTEDAMGYLDRVMTECSKNGNATDCEEQALSQQMGGLPVVETAPAAKPVETIPSQLPVETASAAQSATAHFLKLN